MKFYSERIVLSPDVKESEDAESFGKKTLSGLFTDHLLNEVIKIFFFTDTWTKENETVNSS